MLRSEKLDGFAGAVASVVLLLVAALSVSAFAAAYDYDHDVGRTTVDADEVQPPAAEIQQPLDDAAAEPAASERVHPRPAVDLSAPRGTPGQQQLFDTTRYDFVPESVPSPLGRGSTGRTSPSSMNAQLAMSEVRSLPGGAPTRVRMNDPRWPGSEGWVKMSQSVNGVEIHYVRNGSLVDDFKFKDHEPPRPPGGVQMELPFS